MGKASVVLAMYNGQKYIKEQLDSIRNQLYEPYEVLIIDDCSADDSVNIVFNYIEEWNLKNWHLICNETNLGWKKNFIQGFNKTKGDIVVCLDDDGQTPANEVYKLLDKIEEGEDVVYARYDHKKHSPFRNFGSFINEKMTEFLLGKPKELYVSSYFAAKRFIVDEMLRYDKSYPYVIGLVLRSTKRIANVNVDHREREVGRSGYTLGKLLGLWMNGFTAFSVKPLRIATWTGISCAILGFIYGLYTIIKKFVLGDAVAVGFSALMSSVMFIGGMILFMLGILGEYIGRMYISMNNAPQYVIREVVKKH